MAIFDRAIVRLLPAVPRPVVQKLSERYIAGPELKDARETVRRLNAEAKLATIAVLGEEIRNEDEAAALVLTHFSPSVNGDDLAQEARSIHPRIIAAQDLAEIPLQDGTA